MKTKFNGTQKMNIEMIKNRKFLRYKYLAFLLFGSALFLSGQASLRMQGSLQKPSGKPFDNGFHAVTFKLYEVEVGGQAIWTEVQPQVKVENGLYEASLGSIVPLNLRFNKRYYLGAAVNGGAELAPRAILGNSPYAVSVTGKDNVFPSSGTVGVGTRVPDTLTYLLQLSKTNGTGTLLIEGSQRAELILKKASNSAIGSISFDSSKISIRNLDISIPNNLELPTGASIKYNGLSDWRLVDRDDFSTGNDGWVCHEDWFNTTTKTIQRSIPNTPFSKSNILRPNQHGNDVLKKEFNLTNIPHTMIKVVFTYHFLDSWDSYEYAWAAFATAQNLPSSNNGVQLGNLYVSWQNESPHSFSPDGFSSDPGYFGSSSGTDASAQREITAWHTGNNFWLYFGSTLNSDSNDESYGISNIEIWVR